MTSQYRPILAALACIEEHLQEQFTIQDMAEAAGYSLFHFTRLFNQYTGLTPYDYLIRRRLSDAVRMLVESDKRIIEVAEEYRFGSHESFTRAFSRLFSMAPSQWREEDSHDMRMVIPPLDKNYLTVVNEIIDRRPVITRLEPLRLAGWTIPNSLDEKLDDWWRVLNQITSSTGPAERWIVELPSKEPGPPALQFIGVAKDSEAKPSRTLANYTVEGGMYLQIALNPKGELAHIPAALVYLYHAILPKIKYVVISPIVLIRCNSQMDVMVPVEERNK